MRSGLENASSGHSTPNNRNRDFVAFSGTDGHLRTLQD